MSTLYENIKELCEAKGISGGKMCLEIGISKSTLTSLKNGRTKAIKTENIQKIADYFGVSVDRVLYGKYPEPLKIQYEGYRTGREDERNHQKELLELSEKKEKSPSITGEGNTNQSIVGPEEIKAAFWGGDKELSKEDMDAMWNDVKRFADFVAQQKKQEKKNG